MTRDLAFTAIAAAAFSLLLGAIGCDDEMMDAQPANYVGVGVEITMEAAGARVTRVLEGSGAELAGVGPDEVVRLAAVGDDGVGEGLDCAVLGRGGGAVGWDLEVVPAVGGEDGGVHLLV